MIRERRYLLTCLIGAGLVTVWAVFFLYRSWNMGAPTSLVAALLLATAASLLSVSIVWRAFQGVRPTPRDPAWIAMGFITPAGLLLILATIWVQLRR